jgi:P pilus assembly chaperone PapD
VELRSITARRAGAVAAAVAVAGAGAALLAHATPATSKTAAGGLALSPVVIEQTAKAGGATTVTVANHSAHTLAVTVAARPWKQSVTGAAEPDRRRTLSNVDVSASAFTLKARTERAFTVTLQSVPSTGYEYGALEVIGLPPGADSQKGIVTGYRLIGNLRMDPATPVLKLSTAKVTIVKLGGTRTLALPVTNKGNTVKPITGDVSLKGPLGTRNSGIRSVRILPGKTVDVPLRSTKGLAAGAYKATVELDQGGQTTTVHRNLRIKK